MKLRYVFLVLAATIASFAQTNPQDTSAIDARHMDQPKLTAFEQDLLDTQKTFLDAIKRGDSAAVEKAVANDFVIISANGDSGGKGEIVEAASPHKEGKEAPIFYDFQVLQLADNAGVVTYNVVFPTHIERYQHLSNTWVKEGSQWKLKFQQTTLNLWSAHDL